MVYYVQVGTKKVEVSLFCTFCLLVLAICAIRRSKNEKFLHTHKEGKETRVLLFPFCATLHYGLKLVSGVVRKIGNCFGAAFPLSQERITLD